MKYPDFTFRFHGNSTLSRYVLPTITSILFIVLFFLSFDICYSYQRNCNKWLINHIFFQKTSIQEIVYQLFNVSEEINAYDYFGCCLLKKWSCPGNLERRSRKSCLTTICQSLHQQLTEQHLFGTLFGNIFGSVIYQECHWTAGYLWRHLPNNFLNWWNQYKNNIRLTLLLSTILLNYF